MTVVWIVLAVLAYLFVGGAIGYEARVNLVKHCGCVRRPCYRHNDHAAMWGACWPVTVPVVCGAMWTRRITSGDERAKAKEGRKEKQHQRRLAELEAERKLAAEQKAKTLADIRFLAENGIKAEVPGLYDPEVGA